MRSFLSNHGPNRVAIVSNLEVGYQGSPLLPPISLELLEGQTLFVMGPNGSGKSTFVRTMLGLLPPIRGECRWSSAARLSYVGQRHEGDMTVRRRVIDFVRGGRDTGWSFLRPRWPGQREAYLSEAMKACDIDGLARHQVGELSEGQRQRVYVARALVCEPNILVLDEPTAAMDPVNEAGVLALLAELQGRLGLTIIIVSHRMESVAAISHLGLLIDRRRGVAESSPIDELWNSDGFRSIYGHRPAPGVERNGDPPFGEASDVA